MADITDAYFLSDLSEAEAAKVQAIARMERFTANQSIVEVGDRVTRLFVIGDGAVRVVVPVEGQHGREEQALATLAAGDCFGEFSFVDRQPASASVLAQEASTIYAIEYTDLDDLFADDPHLAGKLLRSILKMVVSRFRNTDANLALTRYVMQYV